MRRPARFVLLAAMVAVLASACSSADVAATVDGVEVVDDQVLALAVQEEGAATVDATNPCQGQQGAAPGQVCVGFRDDLTVLVIFEAMVKAAAEDFGVEGVGTDAARDEFRANASTQAEQVLQTLVALPGRGTQAFEDLIIDQLDIRTRVQSSLVHDEQNLSSLWEQRPDPEIDYCVRHILVATEEEAEAVLVRLGAGEDFSAVAAEISLDTNSPGGFLPCPTDPATWIEPFSTTVINMDVGEISEPVETDFGWHIITIDPRQPTSLAELTADPERWVPQEVTDFWWAEWLDSATARADITVRSQIGSWIGEAQAIAPPVDSP